MGNIIDKCCSKQQKKQNIKLKKDIPKSKINNYQNQANMIHQNIKKSTENITPLVKSSTLETNNTNIQNQNKQTTSLKQSRDLYKKNLTFQDFNIKAKLGAGNFGTVYLVQFWADLDNNNSVEYAMKSIRRQNLINDKVLLQTKLQKQILQKIKHPFITQLKFSFQDQEFIYLVTQYAKGGAVSTLLSLNKYDNPLKNARYQKFKKLGDEGIRFVGASVILAIQHLHKVNIIYRDIKPQNVIIFQDGYPKLTDFGLAKMLTNQTTTNSQAGTLVYLAPQIASKSNYTRLVDLWGLGIFFYQLATSNIPFKQDEILTRSKFKNIVLQNQKNRNWKSYNVNPDLKDLINGFLKYQPQRRLGANDFTEIKNHSFFKEFDWDSHLNKKKVSPLLSIINEHPLKMQTLRAVAKKDNYQSHNPLNTQDEWSYNYYSNV